uniref:ZN692 protein n=1 Tax=Anser brachyrhynchus TaxID=132585 RepID=A0A8B9B975_9AVES
RASSARAGPRAGHVPRVSLRRRAGRGLDRRRGKTRIYVGSHIDRWLTLKEKLDFRNDAEVAGFLLDLFLPGKLVLY